MKDRSGDGYYRLEVTFSLDYYGKEKDGFDTLQSVSREMKLQFGPTSTLLDHSITEMLAPGATRDENPPADTK